MKPLLFAAFIPLLPLAASAEPSRACANAGYATTGAAPVPEASGAYCHDLASCKTFCCRACTGFDSAQWNTDATCPDAPPPSGRMLRSDQVTAITALPNVLVAGSQRATADVIAGLTRLNAAIPALRTKYPQYGEFKAKVKNCWRDAETNTTKVCSLVIRKLHVEQSTTASAATKEQWARNANAVWGLVWPGPTPHSGGFACDIVVVDASGAECFGWAVPDVPADDGSNPACSIPQQTASAILDEAATGPAAGPGIDAVGAVRLNFETWHYEWNSPITSCRCSAANGDPCSAYWPPKGDNSCAKR